MKNKNNLSLKDACSENWPCLSPRQRLAVLQLLENDHAKACGRRSRIVTVGRRFGPNDIAEYIHPKYICIKKEAITSNSPYSGYEAIYSVLHEGYHAFQKDCVNNLVSEEHIPCRDKVDLWQKNFDVYNDDGDYSVPYIKYRFQPIENDAYDYADAQLKNLSSIFSDDAHFNTCVLGKEMNRKMYENDACRMFGENYIKEIADEIADVYDKNHGISSAISVDNACECKSLDDVLHELKQSDSENRENKRMSVQELDNER